MTITGATLTIPVASVTVVLRAREDRFDGRDLKDRARWQRTLQHYADRYAQRQRSVAGTIKLSWLSADPFDWYGNTHDHPVLGFKWDQVPVPDGFYITRDMVDRWGQPRTIKFRYEVETCA